MIAANNEKITIIGAIFLMLQGKDASGNVHKAPIMVYVSPSTDRFYLSRAAMEQLRVIPKTPKPSHMWGPPCRFPSAVEVRPRQYVNAL